MSRFSVICEWTLAEDYLGGSAYYMSMSGNLHIMMIRKDRVESLNTIVHEINECEITNLLRTEMSEDIGGDIHKSYIHVTKNLIKKYPWVFTHKARLEITHIISPYGVKNCIFPRYSSRLSWGKKGK